MKKYLRIAAYWDKVIPVLAVIAFLIGLGDMHAIGQLIAAGLLMGSIMAAVHHSELIAARVGEPFGTIILAISITLIETALIISLMIAGGEKAVFLARDTVFAAVMILLTVITGLCILIGSYKHFEQTFAKKSINTALVSLVAILVLTLVLPNVTTSLDGGRFSIPQLFFVAVACVVIYVSFIYVQTIRHRNYFLSASSSSDAHGQGGNMTVSLIFLLLSLTIVVLLAKSLSPTIEQFIIDADLPHALLGIIIASVVLLPEAIAAIRAAYKNDIQTSLNLSMGSALAAIGLTIPTVVVVSRIFDIDIVLGLDTKSMLLLGLTIFTVMLSLSKGKTNIIYGVILVILFVTWIFTIIYP